MFKDMLQQTFRTRSVGIKFISFPLCNNHIILSLIDNVHCHNCAKSGSMVHTADLFEEAVKSFAAEKTC